MPKRRSMIDVIENVDGLVTIEIASKDNGEPVRQIDDCMGGTSLMMDVYRLEIPKHEILVLAEMLTELAGELEE